MIFAHWQLAPAQLGVEMRYARSRSASGLPLRMTQSLESAEIAKFR